MITKLKIVNFKSHRNTELELGKLTLLTGINGGGKSTILQVLLLLRQTHQKNGFKDGLDLNSPLCYIGTADEALSHGAYNSPMSFEINVDDKILHWDFDPSNNLSKTYIPLEKEELSGSKYLDISLFNNDFQYISALRSFIYERDDITVLSKRQISVTCGKGELVANFLHEYGSKPIDSNLAKGLGIDNKKEPYLIDKVQEWEQSISPGITVMAEKTDGGAFVMKYGFKSTGNNKSLSNLRVENVGFGISYSLPIIVALLSAKPGALILIENPEAHLHPEGQAKIAELIALVSQSGIQVIVETHSDHIVNGIIVACKKFEENKLGIDKNNVRVYYMGEKTERHEAIIEEIKIIAGGKLDRQPKGFFDRMEKDLFYIMGF